MNKPAQGLVALMNGTVIGTVANVRVTTIDGRVLVEGEDFQADRTEGTVKLGDTILDRVSATVERRYIVSYIHRAKPRREAQWKTETTRRFR